MANYHAAFAGGGRMAEWPMPRFDLRSVLLDAPMQIQAGALQVPQAAGLGVRLTPEIEKAFAFRSEAVYRCLVQPGVVADDSVWESCCT
jgi:L-alanine-DL-glutamate epimerase-like enolase superfamily enzyme